MSRQVLRLLLQYEEALAQLYSDCSQHFPEIGSLFDELSAEEEDHAEAIRALMQRLDGRTVFLDDNQFKVRPLEISLEYVQDVNRRITTGEFSILQALSSAYHIETSIIESDYYRIFAGDSAYFNNYLSRLQEESKHHRNKVLQALETIKQT